MAKILYICGKIHYELKAARNHAVIRCLKSVKDVKCLMSVLLLEGCG